MDAVLLSSGCHPGQHGRRAGPSAPPGDAERWDPDALATLMHELRTPLATMHATLELLDQLGTGGNEDTGYLVSRLRHSVEWMTGLVDNASTWAALEAGRLALRRTPLSILDCLHAAARLTQPLLERRGQRVRLACPEPAPHVHGDPLRLGQVVANLLTNASRYGPCGAAIDLVASVERGRVLVRVTDHGPGLPEAEQAAIFGRYIRGQVTRPPGAAGQGLGLHIVKALVELHGGGAGVTSVVGQGASFWFRLPLLEDHPAEQVALTMVEEEHAYGGMEG
jgi:signal transduction histidine kinase